MNEAFQYLNDYIEDKTKLRLGATEAELQQLKDAAPFPLPEEYLDCLRACNGMEGWVNDGYLVLWSIEQTLDHNPGLDMFRDFSPHLLIIGGEGANAVFGIDSRNPKAAYVEIDLIGSSDWNDVFFQCETLVEMLKWFTFGKWAEENAVRENAG